MTSTRWSAHSNDGDAAIDLEPQPQPKLESGPDPRPTPVSKEVPETGRGHTRSLRWPAGVYFLLGDLIAFCIAQTLSWPWHPMRLAALGVLIIAFKGSGLYRSRLSLSLLDDLLFILRGVGAYFLTGVALYSLIPGYDSPGSNIRETAWLLVLVLGIRAALYWSVRAARCSFRVSHAALVVGAGHVGIHLARALKDHPEYGLDPVGFVDTQPRISADAKLPVPVLGGYEDLARVLIQENIRVVLVAFTSVKEAALVDLLRTCDRLNTEILSVPRLYEVHSTTRDMDHVWGIPLMRVRRAPFRTFSWRLKRIFDIVVSLIAIVVLSPFLVVCALLVRMESGRHILFRQERIGLDGQPFRLLKFQSLEPISADEQHTRWNVSGDPRIGTIGRWLRRTSLDELPQLFNILTGDMSLVGPRPERTYFANEFRRYIPRYVGRERVPAGLTGWAQVHGLRGDTSIEDRAVFDNYYIENWSLWTDIKILLATVQRVVWHRDG